MVVVVVPSAPVPKHRGANRLRCAQRPGRKQQVRVIRNQVRINRPILSALRSFWFHGGDLWSPGRSTRDYGSLRHCSKSGFLHLSPVGCTPEPSGPGIQWPKLSGSTTATNVETDNRWRYNAHSQDSLQPPPELASRRDCRRAAGSGVRQRRQEQRKLEATG